MDSLDLKYAKSVILRLTEKDTFMKSDLFDIVTSNQVLDKLLDALKSDGYIRKDLSTYGRRMYSISLTEKGRAAAEQIRRISDVGSKRGMELSDAFKLIIYLHNDGPKDVGSLKKEFPGLFGFVEEMRSSGIITSKVDNSRYPPESLIELTEKGKEVAEKLKEIEEILRE